MVIDRAGNSIAQARNVVLGSSSKTFRDRVGGSDQDFYRIKFTARSSLSLRLQGLQGNADLSLLNEAGQLLKLSRRNGAQPEQIKQTLDAGTYYVRVFPRRGSIKTNYQLVLSAAAVASPPTSNPPTSNPPATSPSTHKFDIQFDYRFDTNGWFTPERRATLEAAAQVWENIIQNDFPDVAAGTRISVMRNPQARTLLYDYSPGVAIDDLLIFPGAANLSGTFGTTLALSGPATAYAGEPRYGSSKFQPWIGTMSFNTGTNWFFDQTPSAVNDVPADKIDFFSVALHELEHVLGFGTSDAFDNQVTSSSFAGSNTKSRNGGKALPLASDLGHTSSGYQYGNSGETLMSPFFDNGQRRLPTALDIAPLQDIGYMVDYTTAAQNAPPARTLVKTLTVKRKLSAAATRSRQARLVG